MAREGGSTGQPRVSDVDAAGVESILGRIDVRKSARSASFARLTSDRLTDCYRLATAILGDPVEAEDATHDAAVRAWERWDSLRDESKFDAWFGRILVNECRDRLRRRRSGPVMEASAPASTSDATDDVAVRDALERALDTLSPDHRIVVVLRYYVGLDDREIAERTGTRRGTVKSRLHYALQALRAVADAAERLEANR